MRKMPSRLLTEWAAFFKIENDDREKKRMQSDVKSGVEEIKRVRRKK